jgi:hypothetical protein
MDWEISTTIFGMTLVLIGIVLILLPIIIRHIPTMDLEKVPWLLLYIYRKDGFFFATSPILIIVGIVYFLWVRFSR